MPIEALLLATGDAPAQEPEKRAIIDLCHEPASLVDLSASLTLPLGVVRVLVGDLCRIGALELCDRPDDPDLDIIRRLIDGVRSI